VMCSTWEARPLALQEAIRAGVPSVATAVGGIPDLVGDAALLVPPGEPDAILEALSRLGVRAGVAPSAEGHAASQTEVLAAAMKVRAATWPGPEDEFEAVLAAYRGPV
jgi:glycosyltransferase involved in cell wall biosynthesis